ACCRSPYIALLNNDTIPDPGWLSGLVADLDSHQEAAIVGGRSVWPNHPELLNHAGGQLTILGAAFDRGYGMHDGPAFGTAGTVGCASGAGMLVRRDAFLSVNGFDEEYFAFFDDADLCWRMWLSGRTVRYQPAARLQHAYGGSSGGSRLSPFR